jgi:PadR family transcriptional regulator PadR
MPPATLDLLQGTLDILVLKALSWGARHGHAVASWIRDTTEDELLIEDGALYTALHRLEKRGLTRAEWGVSDNNRRARYYELTEAGRRALREETSRFSRYTNAVFKVLRATRFATAR